MEITETAARCIVNETSTHIANLSSSDDPLVPSVVWVTGDTGLNSVVPRIGVGLIERSRAQGRFLTCASFECEIVDLIPDNVWDAHTGYSIGLVSEGLAFVKS
jgi:hypothetical protein